MPKGFEGGCLCGAVRYRLQGAPDWSAHCHCRSCQKATGAAFATWVGVKKEKFQVIVGQPTICNSSPGVERSFCGRCGTSLTYVAESAGRGRSASWLQRSMTPPSRLLEPMSMSNIGFPG
jgi:hypothetical protein